MKLRDECKARPCLRLHATVTRMEEQMGTYHIRPMVMADYDAVYALWASTPGLGCNSVDDSRPGIAAFLLRNPATNFVAVAGEEIVGSLLCGHDGRRGYLYHSAVRAGLRHTGVGARVGRSGVGPLWRGSRGLARVGDCVA